MVTVKLQLKEQQLTWVTAKICIIDPSPSPPSNKRGVQIFAIKKGGIGKIRGCFKRSLVFLLHFYQYYFCFTKFEKGRQTIYGDLHKRGGLGPLCQLWYESSMHTKVYQKKDIYECIAEDLKILNKFSKILFIITHKITVTRFFCLYQSFSLTRVPSSRMIWLLLDSNHCKTTLSIF